MAKSLNDILKRYNDVISGKNPSSTVSALTTGDQPGVDYADKMKDARDFIAQHSVEKFDDRVGNGLDVYQAANVKKAEMERHGHEPKPKDIKVYKKNQQVGQAENKLKEEANLGEAKQSRKVSQYLKNMDKAKKDNPWRGEEEPKPKKQSRKVSQYLKNMDKYFREEAENDDGWYAHKEMHGSKAVSKEDWKKGWRLNSKGEKVKKTSGIKEAKDNREYDYEGEMAVTKLKTIVRASEHLIKMMEPNTNLPEWVQSKIIKAEDYITTAHDYLMSEMNEETELSEAKCNMSEAGKMCEVHGMKSCAKENKGKASDEQPMYNGKKKKGKQLILDKDIQEREMTAGEKKKEESLKDKYDDSDMKAKMKKQYGAEKGEQVYFAYIRKQAMKESISDQRSSKSTASERARDKIFTAMQRKKERMEKMKEQAAPAETVIKMPSGEVGDTGRV